MSRVVHFELPVDDPERAAKFYEETVGWAISKWDGPSDYWLVGTGDDSEPGIHGGFYRREKPGQGPTVAISVDDLDATVNRVEAAGGTVNLRRSRIPGVGWHASITDTEGNVVALMQFEPGAEQGGQ